MRIIIENPDYRKVAYACSTLHGLYSLRDLLDELAQRERERRNAIITKA